MVHIVRLILLCHIIWSLRHNSILSSFLKSHFMLARVSQVQSGRSQWTKVGGLLSRFGRWIHGRKNRKVRCQSLKRLIIIRFWRYIFASFKANKIQRINTRNNKTKTTNCENSTYKSGKLNEFRAARTSPHSPSIGQNTKLHFQPIERQLKFIPVSTSVRLPFTFPTIRRNFSRPLLGNFEVNILLYESYSFIGWRRIKHWLL